MGHAKALLEALEQVDSTVFGIDERLQAAMEIMERNSADEISAIHDSADRTSRRFEAAAQEQSRALQVAANEHGKIVTRAGQSIAEGLIVGSTVLVGGLIVSRLMNTIIEYALVVGRMVRQEIQMVDSILKLQENYGSMTYRFVVQRSYAEDSTNEERQNILNGLIAEGVVIDKYQGKNNQLFIDSESVGFLDWSQKFNAFGNQEYIDHV